MNRRCFTNTTPHRRVGVLVMLLGVAALACEPPVVPEAIRPDLAGVWFFEQGWLSGEFTLRETGQGALIGEGRMTASPLEGAWVAEPQGLALFLDTTCPIRGTWRAGEQGGGLRGFTSEMEAATTINIRLAEDYVSPETGPGERLAATLLGTLSDDGGQIGALVEEVEHRLGGEVPDDAMLLLDRQSTPVRHPVALHGSRLARELDLTLEVSSAGECLSQWQFSGALAEDGLKLQGTFAHSVYGSVPVLMARNPTAPTP